MKGVAVGAAATVGVAVGAAAAVGAAVAAGLVGTEVDMEGDEAASAAGPPVALARTTGRGNDISALEASAK